MAQKFKVGDVVRLKSGGPSMTVANYGRYNYDKKEKYLCRWFDDRHKHSEGVFSEEELEVVPP
jgi:uncharacterized protein YodC (DUF2158 family)